MPWGHRGEMRRVGGVGEKELAEAGAAFECRGAGGGFGGGKEAAAFVGGSVGPAICTSVGLAVRARDRDFVLEGEAFVVEALAEEDDVREGVVDGDDDLSIHVSRAQLGSMRAARLTIVGNTFCSTAPAMLNTSPTSQMTMKAIESPSAELRRKFSTICGVKTTTQHAMEIEPQIPLMASIGSDVASDGG